MEPEQIKEIEASIDEISKVIVSVQSQISVLQEQMSQLNDVKHVLIRQLPKDNRLNHLFYGR